MSSPMMNTDRLLICLKNGVKLIQLQQRYQLDGIKRHLDIAPQTVVFRANNSRGSSLYPNDEDLFISVIYRNKSEAEKKLYRVFVLEDAPSVVQHWLSVLQQDLDVEFVQIDQKNQLVTGPNDPFYNEQWGLTMIRANAAWNVSQGNDVVVAVIDTGVDFKHPDIKANMWNGPNGICGTDVTSINPPMDCQVHGTHVAGIIAAVTDNATGIAGVAPKAKIMAVKVFADDSPNDAYDSDLAQGIYSAVRLGAKIINNSWGSKDSRPSNPIVEAAIEYAIFEHVLVVFAAGNNSEDIINFSPVNHGGVIAVASVNSQRKPSSFSNYGAKIAVCAPGGELSDGILSLEAHTEKYRTMYGTSMAAPHVTAVLALIMQINQFLDFERVRSSFNVYGDIIKDDSKPIGKLLNAEKTLSSIQNSPPILRITTTFHLTYDDKDREEEIQLTVYNNGTQIGYGRFGKDLRWPDPSVQDCTVSVSSFFYNELNNISIRLYKTPFGSSTGNGMECEIDFTISGVGFERIVCRVASRRYGDNNPYDVTFNLADRFSYEYPVIVV